MSFVNNVNRVLNAKSTGIFLFGFTGAYKIVSDYQNAPKSEKKKVLLKDTAILAGSAIGLCTYSSVRKSFTSSPFRKNSSMLIDKSYAKLKTTKLWKNLSNTAAKYLKNPVEMVVKNSYNITKDCLDNTLMVGCGILGAIGTDYLMQITRSNKNYIDKKIQNKTQIKQKPVLIKEEPKTHQDPFSKFKTKFKENILDSDFSNIVDDDTKKNIISNIVNMPEMKMFNSSMVGLQSFQVTEEKTFKDKLRHTTRSLLTNTLVPMFFLSFASNLTKGVKSVYRVPIVFTTMVAGTIAANKKIENMKTINE